MTGEITIGDGSRVTVTLKDGALLILFTHALFAHYVKSPFEELSLSERIGDESHLYEFTKKSGEVTAQGYALLWRRGNLRATIIVGGTATARSRVFTGVAIPVPIEVKVVGADHAHRTRVVGAVAAASRAVIVRRRRVEARALVGRDTGRIPEVLDLVGLGGRGSDRFGEYSFGMKQRLGIAAALLGDPALLVLDEPTNGLDPAGINEMREFIRSVGDGERTVLVSSHILSELEQVCDWLIVIDRGSLVYQGPTQGFLGEASTVIALAPEHPGDLERLAALVRADGHEPRHQGDELVVPVPNGDAREVALTLNKAAIAQDIVLAELHARRPSLESQYLSIVGERER